jgi:TRAP-type C4-dicarboxylate transport system substrate-binding protein
MSTPRKIRWLIAHQPQELFFRTARAFSQALKNYSNDEFEIEMLTYDDYVTKYHEIPGLEEMKHSPDSDVIFNEVGMKAFWGALFDSEIEMSQIQVHRVADHHHDFKILDLPFLFEDHDHVKRVVEGPVGQKLCSELGRKSGITGLAFTYSGGYRVVGSHEPIATLDQLSTMKIAVQQPLSLGTTLEDLGGSYAVSAPTEWHHTDPMKNGFDAVETTYLRFKEVNGKYVFKTNHSMFLTTILVSNKFWGSLAPAHQEAFRKAALDASRQERKWSLEDAVKFEAEAEANGVTITEMSAEDTAILKHKAQLSWVKSQKYWEDKEIVKEIVQQRLH